MSLLSSLIEKENVRNQKMIIEYEKELASLPKGSVSAKRIGDNIYYYLNCRDGKKVISKYIGRNDDDIHQISEAIKRRRQIKLILKELKREQEQIKKMEALL